MSNVQQLQVQKNPADLYANNVQTMLAARWKEMQSIVSNALTPERIARVSLNEIRKNPQLAECEPVSFIAAILEAAALGLEPGSLGEVYFIPRNNRDKNYKEVCFQTGYKGEMTLVRRGGEVTKIAAHCVYEGDDFEYELGFDEKLRHVPRASDLSDSKITHCYAICSLKSGEKQFICLTRSQLDVYRKKAQTDKFWKDFFPAMCKKTAIRQLCKWLPKSPNEKRAVALETADSILDVVSLPLEAIPPPNSAPAITADRKAEEAAQIDGALVAVLKTLEDLGEDYRPFVPKELGSKPVEQWSQADQRAVLPRLQALARNQQAKRDS